MEQVDVIDTASQPAGESGRREELKELMLQGLWKNNPSLVQVLGLCPTLAVSSTFTNALGLGLATMVVLVCSNLAVSLVRNWVPKDIRIPVYVMIIAALVTSVQLLMNAYTYGLYQALGIFIALIVTNCVIIGRAEAYASKNPPLLAALDGFMMGLGFTLVLLVLGGLREIIGSVRCAKSSATAPCLTVPSCCWVTGPSHCASSCSTPTPACCWRSCPPAASSASV